MKPLADGLNFMSDAYFVEVKSGEKELSLFAKVENGIFQQSNIKTSLNKGPSREQ